MAVDVRGRPRVAIGRRVLACLPARAAPWLFRVAGVGKRGGCGFRGSVDIRFVWQVPLMAGLQDVGNGGFAWQAWGIVHFEVVQRAFRVASKGKRVT